MIEAFSKKNRTSFLLLADLTQIFFASFPPSRFKNNLQDSRPRIPPVQR